MECIITDIKIMSADLFIEAIKGLKTDLGIQEITYQKEMIFFDIIKKASDPMGNMLGEEKWLFGVKAHDLSEYIKRKTNKNHKIVFIESIELVHLEHPNSKIDDLLAEREYYGQAKGEKINEIDTEILMCYIPPTKASISLIIDTELKPAILEKARYIIKK